MYIYIYIHIVHVIIYVCTYIYIYVYTYIHTICCCMFIVYCDFKQVLVLLAYVCGSLSLSMLKYCVIFPLRPFLAFLVFACVLVMSMFFRLFTYYVVPR